MLDTKEELAFQRMRTREARLYASLIRSTWKKMGLVGKTSFLPLRHAPTFERIIVTPENIHLKILTTVNWWGSPRCVLPRGILLEDCVNPRVLQQLRSVIGLNVTASLNQNGAYLIVHRPAIQEAE